MSEKKTSVTVTIGGDEYSLRSDRSEDYTRAVAAHVDRSLSEVRALGNIVESQKAAILTALAITDELFQVKAADLDLQQRIRRLTEDLARFVPPQKRQTPPL